MGQIECHMLTPLPVVRRYLRRYSGHEARKLEETLRVKMGLSKGQCPGVYGYCNAMFLLDEIAYVPKTIIQAAEEWPRNDPRWPKVCDQCHRPFKDADHWQVFQHALYQRHNGEIIELEQAQAGDIWDAWWYPDAYKNQDGLCLIVALPNGHQWTLDHGGSDGTRWKRTGVPPVLTVTPSVLIPSTGYHAWLRNGVLVDC